MEIRATDRGTQVWLTDWELAELGLDREDISGGSLEGAIFTSAVLVRLRNEGWLREFSEVEMTARLREGGVMLEFAPEDAGKLGYIFRSPAELTEFCRNEPVEGCRGELYGYGGRYLLTLRGCRTSQPPSDSVACAVIKEHGTLLSHAPIEKIQGLFGLSQG